MHTGRQKKRDYKMKVVILAGGYGTRISEESHLKPKPMIELGGGSYSLAYYERIFLLWL